MLRNYLITALRNLKRNRLYTFLNILGLAVGTGCAIVIFKVILFECSFDKNQENYANIYRIVREEVNPEKVVKGMGTEHPLGPAIAAEFPEIKAVARTNYSYVHQLNTYTATGELDKFLYEEGICFVDPAFFQIFTVEWIAGNPKTALTSPNTVVIDQSEARKLFKLTEGQESQAMGKVINYNGKGDFVVVGVIAEPVQATSLPLTILFDYEGQKLTNPYYYEGKEWNSTSSTTNTYVLTDDHFNPEAFDEKLISLVKKYKGKKAATTERLLTQPLSAIHFDSEYGSYTDTVSVRFLYALAIIGVFLIITACINFINLSTAQAANRAKEIGIRKAIGSMNHQLVIQFLTEITLITFFSLLLALAISEIMFNLLKEVIGHSLSLDLLHTPQMLLFILLLLVMVSLLSGFYPAVLLSRMNSILALKRKITSDHHQKFSLRKGLVLLQFSVSQFLIVGTLIISAQMNYFLHTDLGFDTEAIFSSYLPERDSVKIEQFRQQMLTSPAIADVTFSLSEPTGDNNSHSNFNYAPLQSENDYNANFKVVDDHYIPFFDIPIVAGRAIRKNDRTNIVINEKIADLMGFKDRYDQAIGETLTSGWGGDLKIVGVCKNFHSKSLEDELDFVIFLYEPKIFYTLNFKSASMESIAAAREHFEATWEKVFPEYVENYHFYDELLVRRYNEVKRTTTLMETFTVIAILIGCLGLYGLISYIAINKVKEISIRKVLGASITSLLSIISQEVILLIIVAFGITIPLILYFLNLWLDEFTFRISIGPGYFIIGFLSTLGIALLTIAHKTISTALINPAKTLKDD